MSNAVYMKYLSLPVAFCMLLAVWLVYGDMTSISRPVNVERSAMFKLIVDAGEYFRVNEQWPNPVSAPNQIYIDLPSRIRELVGQSVPAGLQAASSSDGSIIVIVAAGGNRKYDVTPGLLLDYLSRPQEDISVTSSVAVEKLAALIARGEMAMADTAILEMWYNPKNGLQSPGDLIVIGLPDGTLVPSDALWRL